MPIWLYDLGCLAWVLAAGALGMTLGRGKNRFVNREEYEADRRRLEGGSIYQEIVWEIRGEAERSLSRLLDLMLSLDDAEDQHAVAEEIKAQQRQLERVHRLLNFKARQ